MTYSTIQQRRDCSWYSCRVKEYLLGNVSFPGTQYHGTGFCQGQVPVGYESCGTVWTSPWQNQFYDIEFLEEALSDIRVLNF